jgi:hypothetical protein
VKKSGPVNLPIRDVLLVPGMVAHACNPAPGRLRLDDYEFKINLGCIARSVSKHNGWEFASVAEILPSTPKALCSIPRHFKKCLKYKDRY